MRKKLLSLALALAMCLGLLPAAASAAEDLPDWYFLFAIFKNVDADGVSAEGVKQHTKYSMGQGEIDFVKEDAPAFAEYMNSLGVMRAHVDVVEIDATVTGLKEADSLGAYVGEEQAALLLEGKAELDRYDHVFCIVSLNDLHTSYLGLTGAPFENGTGHTCINLKNEDYALNTMRSTEMNFSSSMYVHEFLHFMNQLNKKWGSEYDLHKAGDTYNTQAVDNWRGYYTDMILNRATGGYGTGVVPAAWQYPPHVLRTMTELNIPAGVTGIGGYAFDGCSSLKSVTIPAGVASIGKYAFRGCGSLQNVTIPAGVTGIEDWTFGNCAALTWVSVPASVTGIGYAAFWDTGIKDVYYNGTEAQWAAIEIGEYNGALTNAMIHYNSTGPGSQPTAPAATNAANPTNDSLEVNGKAAAPTVYKIGGSNYFKIRDVAALLNGTEKQFTVGYDAALNSVTATTGQGYEKQPGDLAGAATGGEKAAQPSNDTIYVNGKKVDAEVYKIDGSNYFKLRDLGKALNFYVGWTAGRGMYIETDKGYSEP